MKKTIVIALVLACAVPQIVSAVWWNPFTWAIFNRSSAPKVEITDTPETVMEKNTIMCNGKSYTKCAAGQRFVCGATAGECVIEAPTSAQKQSIPQSVVAPALPPASADQMTRLKWMCGLTPELKTTCDQMLPHYSTNQNVRNILDAMLAKVEVEYSKQR